MYGLTPTRDEDCRRGEKSRERIAAEFRRGDFKLLLASEVAGEGLDFEHCHILINYDLPWNPMRIEQRIGRCDRLGQRSDKVHVGNLASVGTIEQRILSRLYTRLRVFEQALGDMEVILGEEVASFERDVFTSGLSPQQQDERLERISQAIENREQQKESVAQSGVISLHGRQLIESDQEEIKEAASRFLSPAEVGEFVHASLERNCPGSVKQLADDTFEVNGTSQTRDALQGLLSTYPPTHYARTDIARFRRRLDEEKKIRVSFSGNADSAEFAHPRHPLVLLGRYLGRDSYSEVPYCLSEAPLGAIDKPTILVWAVGSLEGYTSRAELLCATVACDTGEVCPISVEQAQETLHALKLTQHGFGYDLNQLMVQAEQSLLEQFGLLAETFKLRNNLLADKARQALISHAERKRARVERQLSRQDLKDNIRNMYRGWSRRIESETQSKMEEMERRAQVRSSLQIIGLAVMYPEVA